MKDIPPELNALADYSGLVHAINSISATNTAIVTCLVELTKHTPDSMEYMHEVQKTLELFKEANDALEIVNCRLANKIESYPAAISINAILKAKRE